MSDLDLDALAEAAGHATRTSKKWRAYDGDVLPAWIAEMDFGIADPIREALIEQVRRGDIGYPDPAGDGVPEALAAWALDGWGWRVDPADVRVVPDVMRGMEMCLQAFSEPGEPVVVTTPIYPPFLDAVADYDRVLAPAGLVRNGTGWELDLDAVERGLGDGARLILLCSPHNPTGHVFTREELERLAALALRHQAVIVSDEVHAPLVFEPHVHLSLAELVPDLRRLLVTVTSASKAWNMPGLRCAQIVCQDAALRARLDALPRRLGNGVGILGLTGTVVAFTQGEPWLREVRRGLDERRRLVAELLSSRLPAIGYQPPEASYLAWLDLSALPTGVDGASSWAGELVARGRVALNSGADFGPGGERHVRLNFATSRRRLEEIVDRMALALDPAVREEQTHVAADR